MRVHHNRLYGGSAKHTAVAPTGAPQTGAPHPGAGRTPLPPAGDAHTPTAHTEAPEPALPAGVPHPDASKPADAASVKTLQAFMAAHDEAVRNWVGLAVTDGFQDYLVILAGQAEEYGKRAEEAKQKAEARAGLVEIALSLPFFFVAKVATSVVVAGASQFLAKYERQSAELLTKELEKALTSEAATAVVDRTKEVIGKLASAKVTSSNGAWGYMQDYVQQLNAGLMEIKKRLCAPIKDKSSSFAQLAAIMRLWRICRPINLRFSLSPS